MSSFTHAHYSGRFDRLIEGMVADLDRIGGSLQTITEVNDDRRARALRSAVYEVVFHPTPGGSDCAIRYDRADWEPVGEPVHGRLSDRFHMRGAKRVYNFHLTQLLRHKASGKTLCVSVAHLPAGVEYGNGWRSTGPVEMHKDSARIWHRLVHDIEADEYLMAADFNVDIKRPVFQKWAADTFPGMRPTWSAQFPTRGTHAGGRLIDWALISDGITVEKKPALQATTASDHVAFAQTLALEVAMPSISLRVGTANEQDFPEAAISYEQAFEDLVKDLQTVDVLGMQEIGTIENRSALAKALGEVGHYGSHAAQSASPVAWRDSRFEVISKGVERLHGGAAGICLARHITWAVLRDKASGTTFGVVSLHMVPGAWSPGHSSPQTRMNMWLEGRRNLLAFLTAHNGLPWIVTGDFNRQVRKGLVLTPASLGDNRKVKQVCPRGSIDHIYLLDSATHSWTAGRVRTEKRESDHPLRWLDVRLTQAPTPKETPMATPHKASAAEVIAVAKSQIGVHEGRSGGHWNNHQRYSKEIAGLEWSDGQPWCATFTCWVLIEASHSRALLPAVSASCDVMGAAWKKAGRWSEFPAIGALVYYGKPSDLTHTGIVVAYDKTYIYVIEGNTNDGGSREGDGVYLRKRKRLDPWVVGYGYPAYDAGIQSADPAWGHQNPAPALVKPVAKPKRFPNIDDALVSLAKAKDAAQRAGDTTRVKKITAAMKTVQALGDAA